MDGQITRRGAQLLNIDCSRPGISTLLGERAVVVGNRTESRSGHSSLAIALVWLLVIETAVDTVLNVSGGIREHLFGAATGVTWMVVSFYIPLLMVSLGLTVWQLYSRRGQPLASSSSLTPSASRAA